jgi:hypothetical protein
MRSIMNLHTFEREYNERLSGMGRGEGPAQHGERRSRQLRTAEADYGTALSGTVDVAGRLEICHFACASTYCEVDFADALPRCVRGVVTADSR